MNKKDLLIERTSISDIKEIKDEDGVSRHELNTPTKIIVWIKYQFEQQEIDYNKEYRPFSFSKRIDLSNCIINTSSVGGKPSLTNLSDILKANDKGEKLDCFINNGFGNKYNHEVKVKIDCRNSLIHSGFFQNTKFHESVNFEDSTFDGYASFSNCLFTKYADFQKVKFVGNFDFSVSTFNDNVYFHGAIFDTVQIHFHHSIFQKKFQAQNLEFSTHENSPTPFIDFRNSEFHKDVYLSYNKFDRACYFGNTKFHDNVLFQKSHFLVSVDFFNAEIKGSILFSPSPAEDDLEVIPNTINEISFDRSKISGRIDFENCEIDLLEVCFAHIQKEALFRIYESKINYLNFRSVHNDGIIILANNQDLIDEITFKSAINTGLIEIENTKVKIIEDRKTARLLKDSALKSGNTIDGLNYKAKEMALYQKELISKIKPSLELKTLLSNLLNSIKRKIVLSVLFAIPAIIIALISHQILNTLIAFLIISVFIWTSVGLFLNEMIVLLLNTISNKNGLSWFRGLTFTLVAWILFYGLFIMSRDGIGDVFFLSIETNREGFINYLWLPSGLKDLFNDSKTTSWLSSSIFILGKIAIAYGIYQTITAFRKYKN
ncbi:pentapeptide repeat-containing protein [Labilibaculum euxinus]|uniref:Pentapeptide repeat-containing protein n=1 Tax=Labilibaculum euxinus TaxID=2686357 RepID=A0A7M4DBU5_9BACT|nr:pentapeptide repeat-containing protein [Labilibaculum euxinus]MUP40124.1 hypothetical protein [Labilibaculum euxinus]MVB09329.1 hypothetical protein [Labilibaculum euxinus]